MNPRQRGRESAMRSTTMPAAGFVKRGLTLAIAVAGVWLALAAPAFGATPAAGLTLDSFAKPSNFSTSDTCARGESACDVYEVIARNAGSQATDGSPIVLADTLPAGVTVSKVELIWSAVPGQDFGLFFCETGSVRCSFPVGLEPDQTLRMLVYVMLQPGASGALKDTATVSGGGATEASTSVQNAIGAPPPFGFADFSARIMGVDGAPDTQAGDHPYELATSVELNNAWKASPEGPLADTSVHDVKDVVVDLPLGFLGSAIATPQCTLAQDSSLKQCPLDTVIGHVRTEPPAGVAVNSPLYNVVPERGVAAEFGFADVTFAPHVLYASVVATTRGYVLRTTARELPQLTLTKIDVTFFGNPAVKGESGITPAGFFTNPSSCSGEPLVTSAHMDSWQAPGRHNADGTPDFTDPNWVGTTFSSPAVTGCNLLQFSAGMSVQPETAAADSPTGLNVDLKVPQSEDPSTLATPPLRDASIALPVGMSLNPAAADGLGSCSLAQIDLSSTSEPSCPDSSKVGTVELQTPLLPGVLGGSIYLAAQEENPFHALVAAYIVVDDPVTGVVLKIPGQLELDPSTGQITGVFDGAPQFPFSDLKLHFFGGQRGVLATPQACGTYTTGSVLSPWSAPDSGAAASPSDSFQISSGCVSGFGPSFEGGSTGTQAGGFTGFTTTLSRSDQDQGFGAITLRTPPGLLGVLKSVVQCPEPQASAGACGAGSLIGRTTVAAGVGSHPFYLGGEVFLTGPYRGAPFGLSIVVPAVAGPFNLGVVVVRTQIQVDPSTAQLTIVSDPLPTILRGIPLDIKTINVTVDRPGFIFNPTSCEPMSVLESTSSTQGASSQGASRFQAANCAGLPFHPVLATTSLAKTSLANGAALDVKVSYPGGSQANIHSVAVTLPRQLPARLSTIQQACPAAVFDVNPASCDVGSMIGVGTARTPIFNNALVGPTYLVSHGGAAFPDVDVVLQGEGVTLNLVGHINISKAGITSATFFAVPDAPISSFELSLPEGPHSGLAAVGSLCAGSLTMPTTIVGQNGAQIRQTTKINVTGCSKTAKGKHKAKKPRKTKKKGKGRKASRTRGGMGRAGKGR
jgi:hypothetical protein